MEANTMEAAGPVRMIYYLHRAIRSELRVLRDLAEVPEADVDIRAIAARAGFLIPFIQGHARSEETFLFPVLEDLRADISKGYVWDHRRDETCFAGIQASLARLEAGRDRAGYTNLLRNIHALQAVLTSHTLKEEALLIPLTDTDITVGRQWEIANAILSHIPKPVFDGGLRWTLQRISAPDAVDYLSLLGQSRAGITCREVAGWARDSLPEPERGKVLKTLPVT